MTVLCYALVKSTWPNNDFCWENFSRDITYFYPAFMGSDCEFGSRLKSIYVDAALW